MTIEFNAFQNCSSLKELHFEKCNQLIVTNIRNCDVPNDMQIIVDDKMYWKFYNAEVPVNKRRILPYSAYLQKKIDSTKNCNIIISIIKLNQIVNLLDCNYQETKDIISQIKQCLCLKYNISNALVNYVQHLMQKKQEVQDESQL